MYLPFLLSLSLQAGAGPGNLTFLAYLDIWIISGLVLLAVVVVVGKWLWNRLRRREDEDDYWDYYDEDYILDDNEPGDRD